MPENQYSLEGFAYRKQAPVDAVINAVLNTIITLLGLWGMGSVHVVPPPPPVGSFTHSLFGSLFPMAIIMTLVVTIVGVRTTVKKRIAGEVSPRLDPKVRWFKPALATGILHALAAFGFFSIFALIIHYKWPLATISVPLAAAVVAAVAAILAYIESVAAVLRTRQLTQPPEEVTEKP
jgi:hypothetical protein